MTELDATDLRLLALLQEDNQLTVRELAERAFTSAPTCLRRVRQLRRSGVIRADVSVVDPAMVGLGLTVFVEVTLARQQAADLAAFERTMAKLPEVVYCCEISGESDFMLTVLARDMAAYSTFSRQHLAGDAAIRTFRSMFVMREAKRTYRVPLER